MPTKNAVSVTTHTTTSGTHQIAEVTLRYRMCEPNGLTKPKPC